LKILWEWITASSSAQTEVANPSAWRRRAKTDRIDGETLLRALLAAKRERADKAIAAFEALARRLEAMAEARRPAWWRWLRFAD
jgi:transposase